MNLILTFGKTHDTYYYYLVQEYNEEVLILKTQGTGTWYISIVIMRWHGKILIHPTLAFTTIEKKGGT